MTSARRSFWKHINIIKHNLVVRNWEVIEFMFIINKKKNWSPAGRTKEVSNSMHPRFDFNKKSAPSKRWNRLLHSLSIQLNDSLCIILVFILINVAIKILDSHVRICLFDGQNVSITLIVRNSNQIFCFILL